MGNKSYMLCNIHINNWRYLSGPKYQLCGPQHEICNDFFQKVNQHSKTGWEEISTTYKTYTTTFSNNFKVNIFCSYDYRNEIFFVNEIL